MSSRDIKIQAFNQNLYDLIDFIESRFPNEVGFVSYKTQLSLLFMATPDIVYNFFIEYVKPHEDIIKSCNEKEIYEKVLTMISTFEVQFIDFKQIWNLPENDMKTKATVFKYLIKLVNFC